jgi:hypothetical protein
MISEVFSSFTIHHPDSLFTNSAHSLRPSHLGIHQHRAKPRLDAGEVQRVLAHGRYGQAAEVGVVPVWEGINSFVM